MDTQPKIPTLKDSQKPQVKVRGLEAGVTLFDRLKQFKKKDLAFILAGLGTLFMAPLAEHFMMSPETADGTQLKQGWGQGGNKGPFDGTGNSPYEPGTTGLAPGSAIGGGSDIITPLNVRDPSALVMGPGATQQPPTNSVMPSTPPPTAPATHSDSDLKDALAASARGVTAAAHAAKALLPIPKIALSGSGGLRGLGVVSGGSSASGSSAPSSTGLVSGKAANNGNIGGISGAHGVTVAPRGPTNGGGGALDALKAAGDKAAGAFNRPSASAGLNEAANTAIPTGGGSTGGLGAGVGGSTDKATGGDANKDGKNVGESLAFLKQKAIQDAQIALWAKEQEAGDNKLEALKIRNSMAESFTGAIATAAGNQVTCLFTGNSGSNCPAAASGNATTYYCTPAAGGAPIPIKASTVGKDNGSCTATPGGKDNAGATAAMQYWTSNGTYLHGCPPNQEYPSCTGNGPTPAGSDKSSTGGGIGDGFGGVGGMSGSPQTDLGPACGDLGALKGKLDGMTTNNQAQKAAAVTVSKNIVTMTAQARILVNIRDSIGSSAATGSGIPDSGDCLGGGSSASNPLGLTGSSPVAAQLNAIVNTGNSSILLQAKGIGDRMKGAVTATDPSKPTDLTALGNDVNDPKTGIVYNIQTVGTDVGTLQTTYGKVDQSLMSAPDPLGLAALKASLGTNYDSSTADKAATAAKNIQNSWLGTQKTLNNLKTAVNTDLNPQVALLQGSVGSNGTLQSLVANNNGLDAVGGAGTTGMKVPSPLTAPKVAPPQNASSDGTIKTMTTDLANAKKDIADATTKVAAFAPNAASDKTCASDPCKAAQTALNLAGTDVGTIQADQTAINAAITKGAQDAGNVVGLTPPSK